MICPKSLYRSLNEAEISPGKKRLIHPYPIVLYTKSWYRRISFEDMFHVNIFTSLVIKTAMNDPCNCTTLEKKKLPLCRGT